MPRQAPVSPGFGCLPDDNAHTMDLSQERRRLRVGQPITPDEFELLSDAQLARLVPKAYRDFFPGKENCADGHFYLHDGTAWCFYKGDLLDG